MSYLRSVDGSIHISLLKSLGITNRDCTQEKQSRQTIVYRSQDDQCGYGPYRLCNASVQRSANRAGKLSLVLLITCLRGYWAIKTERTRHTSALACSLGHFEWLRMPFGFKFTDYLSPISGQCAMGPRQTQSKDEMVR